jgi:hypothetical protein
MRKNIDQFKNRSLDEIAERPNAGYTMFCNRNVSSINFELQGAKGSMAEVFMTKPPAI